MASLIIKDAKGETRRYSIHKTPFSIGRSRTNDLPLETKIVSRDHAQIVRDKGGLVLVDLNSLNGTFLNGSPIKKAPLKHGDEIRVGETLMVFQETPAQDIRFSKDPSVLDSKTTAVISIDEVGLVGLVGEEKRRAAAKMDQRIEELERNNRSLVILYKLSEKLMSSVSLSELLDLILELIFRSLDVERGFLMLMDEEGNLVPQAIRCKDSSSGGRERITVSQSILKKVTQDRVAVLSSDAMVDPRFSDGESIKIHGIRSAMCVPLWRGKDIIGIIHLDNFKKAGRFTETDLELLTAIANLASIGIEQTRLNEKIIHEVQIRNNLERFHSPDVINTIMEESVEGGTLSRRVEEKQATVLFTDIQNFTLLAERLSAPEVAALLNEYFSLTTDIVFEYDGTLDKYIGDGIMAVFGAPYTHGNDAEKAVLAALKMRETLGRVMGQKDEKHRFNVRIGINTGTVVAGYIGSVRRLEYSVLGDVVNVASYLESIAKPNEILIGEETYRQVGSAFRLEEVGRTRVKGGISEVSCYRVTGRA
jgi:adenylate cyclase